MNEELCLKFFNGSYNKSFNFFFNDVTVMKVDEHKHLGVVLDNRLTFSSHIQSAINKSRRGIDASVFI